MIHEWGGRLCRPIRGAADPPGKSRIGGSRFRVTKDARERVPPKRQDERKMGAGRL